jgi:hypothetical protein
MQFYFLFYEYFPSFKLFVAEVSTCKLFKFFEFVKILTEKRQSFTSDVIFTESDINKSISSRDINERRDTFRSDPTIVHG